MSRRVSRSLAALLLVPALAACTIVHTRQSSPGSVLKLTPREVADGVTVRQARVTVPDRYDKPYVEFGDRDHGYALFASCAGRPPGPGCPALLFATADGGRSWRRIPHPQPLGKKQQLQVTVDVPVLFVAGDGWYYSLNGRSFQHAPGATPPPVVRALRSWVQLDDRTGGVVGWYAGVWRPLPVQPPLSRPQAVYGSDGLVLAASVADGRPLLAVSFDSGVHWHRPRVPNPDGEINAIRVAPSVRGDVWLIGERRDPAQLPALWHYDGAWRPVMMDRYPEPFVSLVPFGESRLAVSGPDGGGVVIDDSGHYVDKSWPLRGDHRLTLLSDGTLLARGPDDVLLGNTPDAAQWVRVVLERRRLPLEE
ncbi:hypothetical protein NCC78_01740 [Micromonospora phytophila]|uniref:hypothetical protein n=1 Tax=Micromonospora phytophila TaxID=709888 RepID=UPI00202E55E5|nr:hypothetical protein [Micromonospora phytophila]MCM0673448.1 hypothetical protein [Micromonospora phytophila]